MGIDYATSHDAVRAGRQLLDAARAALAQLKELHDRVRELHAELVADAAQRSLDDLDLATMREVTSATHLHLAPLRAAGLQTVGDVLRAPASQLDRLPGLGPARVRAIRLAAEALATAATAAQVVRLDPQHPTRAADLLVTALAQALLLGEPGRELTQWEALTGVRLASALDDALPAANRLRWTLAGRRGRELAGAAAARVLELVDASPQAALAADRVLRRGPALKPRQAWQQFTQSGADYYAELERLTGAAAPRSRQLGGLASEVVNRVERQQLDESLLVGSLRSYQHFGARFILAQQRVIVGDEMGLGKTFQAIAAMAHLAAHGQTHFVVICPASVLVNWGREVAVRSRLVAHRLHGDDREEAMARWQRTGGVAVTTFETMQVLDWPTWPAALVIVDEAHYLKNPQTRRAQACAQLLTASPRAALLTGTPLENRVEEFTNLVRLVQPELVDRLDAAGLRLGPDAFRRTAAPVYLRRNQDDVLMELPERIETDEWVEFGPPERFAYRRAVAAGNWMAMRQAGFAGDASEKLARLVELCAEAAENQRKVVVFSYFLDVLDQVRRTLAGRGLGPLTGALPPEQRQELIDEFGSAPPDRVLLAQVLAGGVGLNIQAASVVILCEPQLKPSTEQQAIARVHRMGQVRTVDVHRLCAEDSVDERILELLADKQQVFDDFAARSAVAEASTEAIDPGRPAVAELVIATERARLQVG